MDDFLPQKPLTYRDVLNKYDAFKLRKPETKLDLPAFSGRLNELSGTQLFDAGLNDNIIKRASVGIDKGFEATGLAGLGADIGGTIGSFLGSEQAGRDVGQTLPRSIAAGAGAGLASLLTGPAAPVTAAIAVPAAMGIDTAAQTYTQTDSPMAGLLAGGVAAAAPAFGKYGGGLAAQKLGVKVGPEIAGSPTLAALTEKLIEKTGMELGFAVNEEVGRQATNLGMGRFKEGFIPTKEDIVGLAVGTIAPLGIDAVTGIATVRPPREGQFRSLSEAIRRRGEVDQEFQRNVDEVLKQESTRVQQEAADQQRDADYDMLQLQTFGDESPMYGLEKAAPYNPDVTKTFLGEAVTKVKEPDNRPEVAAVTRAKEQTSVLTPEQIIALTSVPNPVTQTNPTYLVESLPTNPTSEQFVNKASEILQHLNSLSNLSPREKELKNRLERVWDKQMYAAPENSAFGQEYKTTVLMLNRLNDETNRTVYPSLFKTQPEVQAFPNQSPTQGAQLNHLSRLRVMSDTERISAVQNMSVEQRRELATELGVDQAKYNDSQIGFQVRAKLREGTWEQQFEQQNPAIVDKARTVEDNAVKLTPLEKVEVAAITKELVAATPKVEDVAQTIALAQEVTKKPVIDLTSFQEVAELNNELVSQVNRNRSLGVQVDPITDKWIQDRYEKFLSEGNSHMTAMRMVGESARNKVVEDTNKLNLVLLAHKDQQDAERAALDVDRELDDSEAIQVVAAESPDLMLEYRELLMNGDSADMPVDPTGTFISWARNKRLSQSENARDVIVDMWSLIDQQGAHLTQKQRRELIKDLPVSLQRDVLRKYAALFKKSTNGMYSSKTYKKISEGNYDIELAAYMKTAETNEKLQNVREADSLDRELGEDGGTVGDLVGEQSVADYARQIAAIKHGDDVIAQETSAELNAPKVAQVERLLAPIHDMTEEQIREVATLAKIKQPANIEKFRQRILAVARAQQQMLKGSGLYKHLLENEPIFAGQISAQHNMQQVVKPVNEWLKAFGEKQNGAKPSEPSKSVGKIEAETVDDLPSLAEIVEVGDGTFLDTTKFAAPITAYAWADSYFDKQSYAKGTPEHKTSVEAMVKITLAMKHVDKVLIGTLINDRSDSWFGLAFQKQNLLTGKLIDFATAVKNRIVKDSKSANRFMAHMTMAHELWHPIENSRAQDAHDPIKMKVAEAQAVNRAFDMAEAMTPDDRATVLTEMARYMLPKVSPQLGENFGGMIEYSATSAKEFLATFNGMLMLGSAMPAVGPYKTATSLQSFFKYMPDPLRQFAQSRFANMAEMGSALRGYFNELGDGLGDKVFVLINDYKTLARTSKEIQQAYSTFLELQRNSPEEFFKRMEDMRFEAVARGTGDVGDANEKIHVTTTRDLLEFQQLNAEVMKSKLKTSKAAIKEAKKFIEPERIASVYGQDPGGWALLEPLAQFGERFPIVRPLVDLAFSFNEMVDNANANTFKPFLVKDVFGKSVLDGEFTALKDVMNDQRAMTAVNKILLFQNKELERARIATPEEIDRFSAGLSPKQRDNIKSIIPALSQSMQTTAVANLRAAMEIGGIGVGRMVMAANPTIDHKTAVSIGKDFVTSVGDVTLAETDGRPVSPMTLQQLDSVRARLGDDIFNRMLPAVKLLGSEYAKQSKNLLSKPGYATEVRPGKFGLYYKRAGETVYTSFDTEEQAIAAYDAANSQPNTTDARLINSYEREQQLGSFTDGGIDILAKFERAAFETARQLAPAGDQEALARFAEDYTPLQTAFNELTKKGVKKYFKEFKAVGGREDLDLLTNSLNYMSAMSRANARSYVRAMMNVITVDPSIKNEARLITPLRDHINNVLNPPESSFTKFKELVFQYFMGANVSSAMMEVVQPALSVLPYFTRQGMGIADGYKRLGQTTQKLMSAYVKNYSASRTVEQLGKDLGSHDLAWAMDKAVKERVIGFGYLDETRDLTDNAITNLVKLANNSGEIRPVTDQLKNAAMWYAKTTRAMYSKFPEHNAKLTFMMGFDWGMEQGKKLGLDGQQLREYAYAEAKKTKNATNFGGGTAARPLGFGQLQGTYGMWGLAYTMSQYSFSMIAMMARMGNEAIGRTGLQGGELRQARKAFGQAMMTQSLLAGALGMPFAGASVAILEQIFPDLELNKGIRDLLNDVFGSDEEQGGVVTNAVLKGLPSALGPFDVSGRFGLSAMLGTSPYYGFNPGDLFGASGSMVSNWVLGAQNLSQGNITDGVGKMVPVAWQKLINAQKDQGMVRDGAGNLLFAPTDIERIGTLAGFRPNRLSNIKEAEAVMKRHQRIENRQLARFYEEQEERLIAGDTQGVRNALLEKARQTPGFDPKAALRRISKGVIDRSEPVDLGTRGTQRTAESNAATLSTFGVNRPPSMSASQRLATQAALESTVGIPGAGRITKGQMSRAQQIDHVMQSFGVTHKQAELMLDANNGNPINSEMN